MRVLIFLICIVSVTSNNETCNQCIKVDSICHKVAYLFPLKAPFRNTVVITKIGILKSKNILYFAFESKFEDPEAYKIGFVELSNNYTTGVVNGSRLVNNFATFDIDQENNIVFVGGSTGLYFLDSSNKATFFSSAGDTIKSLFYKGNVFFVTAGVDIIVEKRGDEFRNYENYRKVKNFVINKNNILVFLNNTGLYANKFRTNDTVYLSKNAFFRGLTLDLEGTVYAWWVDGIYKVIIDRIFKESKVVKVADINGIGAVMFDDNNDFLFTAGKSMFRLSKTNYTSC